MNRVLVTFALCTLVVACGDPEPEVTEPEIANASVSGVVVFRESIGLTPESRLEIELTDVSLADAPATVIATVAIDNPGQSPIAFTLEYDASLIDDRHSYSIGARVLDRGHLILVSDNINPALTRNAPEVVTVYAVRVSQNKRDKPDASIVGTQWLLSSVNGRHVDRPERGPEIHVALDEAAGTVSGFGGCNRFKGSYQLQGSKLAFGNLAVTAMACAEGGDRETEFLQALGALDEVRVNGRTLVGFQQGAVIISFEADQPR